MDTDVRVKSNFHLFVIAFFFQLGHCKVDETEKGWFIAYIDRDPDTIERQKVHIVEPKILLLSLYKRVSLLINCGAASVGEYKIVIWFYQLS